MSARSIGCLLWLVLCACGEASAPAPSASTPGGTSAPSPPATPPPIPVAAPPPPPSRIEAVGPYQADVGRDCAGDPHLALRTPAPLCVGLVLHADHPSIADLPGRFRPRTIVEDPSVPNVFWVVDAGARRDRAGRLFRLDARSRPVTIERVVDRLDRPHGSAIGPDGWLYVGEVQRVVRFDPRATNVAASRQIVIDGLPTRIPGRDRLRFHPLRAMAFASDWSLVVNMGSATDHCEESAGEPRCHDEADHTAALWRFAHREEGGVHSWSSEPEHLAHGLRNSMAIAIHGSGTILQAENGVDLSDPALPHEELNVIEPGRHYGWPYCYDAATPDPRWAHAGFGCDASNADYTPPHLLLPAHGAPLHMAFYEAEALMPLRGRLLVSLHGYRALGHRLLSFTVDARGLPARDAVPDEVIAGWDASDTGPRGAPVGFTTARDGSLWIVDDTNGNVLRLAVDAWAASRSGDAPPPSDPVPVADAAFVALHAEVLRPRCAHCHELLAAEPDAALAAMAREGWLREERGETHVWERTRPGASARMPLDGALTEDETAQLRSWLEGR